MRKNIVEPGRPRMTIWRMSFVCWIPKATDTHSEYVMLIAFPPQKWLHERVSMLRYTYIDCPLTFTNTITLSIVGVCNLLLCAFHCLCEAC